MSIFHNPALLGAGGQSTGYNVSRSLRFNSSDSAYCGRTVSSANTSNTTSTLSWWCKRTKLGATSCLFSGYDGSSTYATYIQFDAGDTFTVTNPGYNVALTTSQVFRDPSAWYHFVLVWDTTNATSSNRYRLFVNGVRVTAFSTAVYPSQNDTGRFIYANSNNRIGTTWGSSGYSYCDAYLADVHLVDGQALDPTSFGQFDATTGVWVPKAYTGTYGTNGFKLDFADNSSNTATTLGKDGSNNGNNWTPNNISVSTTSQNTYTGAGDYLDRALDGIVGNSSTTNQAYTATFTAPIAYNSLLIVYGNMANGALGNPATGAVLSVNGSAVTATGTYGLNGYSSAYNKYYQTNTPGTLTSLGMSAGVGGSHESGIFEVYVNGSLLVRITPAGNDSLVDVPTTSGTDTGAGGEVRGNYCTWNPLANSAAQLTYSNGNLDLSQSNTASYALAQGTIGVSSGKWYFEVAITSTGTCRTGVTRSDSSLSTFLGSASTAYAYASGGYKANNNSNTTTGYSTYTNGDVVGVALDLDAGRIFFSKNGTWQESGNPATGTNPAYSGLSGTYFPSWGKDDYVSTSCVLNTGARSFAYTAPSGFKALCTANLPAPLVTKPSTQFQVVTDTGANIRSTAEALTFGGDLIWIKDRANNSTNHQLLDTTRGGNAIISTSSDAAEGTYSAPSGNSVAWCWNESVTAGFDIVGYAGDNTSNRNISHSLGVAVDMAWIKSRSSGSFYIWHRSLASTTHFLKCNQTDGTASSTNTNSPFGTGNWSSTQFMVTNNATNNLNAASTNYIAYLWSTVVGYSNGFSYTGNGSTDGSFVYLGFRPRLILLKCSSTTGNWTLVDTAREGYNVDNDPLYPNLSDAEGTADLLDITSNGFKLRTTDASVNSNAATYIGFAWAESPFNYSRAR